MFSSRYYLFKSIALGLWVFGLGHSYAFAAEKANANSVNQQLKVVSDWYRSENPFVKKLDIWFDPAKTNFQKRFGTLQFDSQIQLDADDENFLGDFHLHMDFLFKQAEESEQSFASAAGKFSFNGDVVWTLGRVLESFKKNCMELNLDYLDDITAIRETILCREIKKLEPVDSFEDVTDFVLSFIAMNGTACTYAINYLKKRLPKYLEDDPGRPEILAEIERLRSTREQMLAFKFQFLKDSEGTITGILVSSPEKTHIGLGDNGAVALRRFYFRKGQFLITKDNLQLTFLVEKRERLGFFFIWYTAAIRRFLPQIQSGNEEAMQGLKKELEGSLLKVFEWVKADEQVPQQ